MNALIAALVGFAIGGVVIGTTLTAQVATCVHDNAAPCLVQQTLTGVKVYPLASHSKEGEQG